MLHTLSGLLKSPVPFFSSHEIVLFPSLVVVAWVEEEEEECVGVFDGEVTAPAMKRGILNGLVSIRVGVEITRFGLSGDCCSRKKFQVHR